MILKSVDPEPLQKELYLSEKDLVRQRHITPPKNEKKIDLLNIITRVTVSKYSSKLCRAVCYHLYLLHLYLFLNW